MSAETLSPFGGIQSSALLKNGCHGGFCFSGASCPGRKRTLNGAHSSSLIAPIQLSAVESSFLISSAKPSQGEDSAAGFPSITDLMGLHKLPTFSYRPEPAPLPLVENLKGRSGSGIGKRSSRSWTALPRSASRSMLEMIQFK